MVTISRWPGLLISGSKVRVLDGPPNESATSGSPGWPISRSDPGLATNWLPTVPTCAAPRASIRASSSRSTARRSVRGSQRAYQRSVGRRVRVAKLRAHIRDGRALGQEQRRERVAEVVEPEPRQFRPPEGPGESLSDATLIEWRAGLGAEDPRRQLQPFTEELLAHAVSLESGSWSSFRHAPASSTHATSGTGCSM
jgi:hypothetical protein